ncbi:ABC transporter permease [Bifidobacterium sp. ESL0732]|uniref:ABC transporter permease n=1 Tax=Bifidobacterium sp. ESL0732 TaxID=2983222 RepID=UPI0023FA0B08|nr:ABC transporter permease [Bifidobacterium sp. ESL0732]WEV63819.1 ABC transporter permease [Bifidobacterium sp. ESL0732]
MTMSTQQDAALSLVDENRQSSAERAHKADQVRRILQNAGIVIPLAIVIIFELLFVPKFLSASNVTNMLINASILAILALGQTVVIAIFGIDLSVGAMQALVVCVTAMMVNKMNPVLAIICAIVFGGILGFFNGFVVVKLRVTDFIATLSTMNIYRGLALLITAGLPIEIMSGSFKKIATASIVHIPVTFILALLVGFGTWFILEKAPIGKHIVAVGDNALAARDSGISVEGTIIKAYLFCGLTAGLAGVLLASQLGTVNATVSTGLELQTIAVVVIGGTSMSGGHPRVIGTLLGALLLTIINSGLNILNIPSFYQYVAIGALLVFALSLDSGQRVMVARMFKGR